MTSRATVWVREGVANVLHSGALMTTLVGIVIAVLTGAVLLDTLTAARIVSAESRYLDDGGDIVVAMRLGMDAASCEAVNDLTGVRAAGSVQIASLVTEIAGRPQSQQSVVLVSPGALGMLGDRPDRSADVALEDLPELAPEAADTLISPAIAERHGWRTGSWLQLTGGQVGGLSLPTSPLRVAGIADLSVFSDAASAAVLLVRPAQGQVDTCYVRTQPHQREAISAALPAVLGETLDQPVNVVQALPAGAGATDPAEALDARPTRWVGLAAGAFVGLLWAVVAWTRRTRTALYETIGLSRSDSFVVRWTEGVVVLMLGGAWGLALGVTFSAALGCPVELALRWATAVVGSALGVGLLLVTLATLWRPNTMLALKDR